MQKMLLLVYMPMPILLAMLVSEVRCGDAFVCVSPPLLRRREDFLRQGL